MSANEMPFARSSGVLLHITSLPGEYGIGDLGPEAHAFVDRLHNAGQTYWQVLPLGPTGFADSPYQCLSSFAGNTNLISLHGLDKEGWLPVQALEDRPQFRKRRVDYETVIPWHDEMLSLAYEGFVAQGGLENADFTEYCKHNEHWLDDFAMFMALKESHQQKPWVEWPSGESLRAPIEIEAVQERHNSRIGEHRFRQWVFHTQWRELRKHAQRRGISIIGDIPIYVAHDSCDVWVNRNLFDLDGDGYPRVVAGVPPDSFSPIEGQLWGNPLYLWDEHKKNKYEWWIKRVRAALDLFDVVRIDHFRGFHKYWQIPATATTARGGSWMDGPQDDFFTALSDALSESPGRKLKEVVIAEDLGDKMDVVREWRQHKLELAGMKILQFAFGDNPDERKQFKPEKHVVSNDDLSISYVGTHDNNTVMGWWYTKAKVHNRDEVTQYVRVWNDNPSYVITTEPNWEIIGIGMKSKELVFIMPLQDILGAGNSSRMNWPGVATGNWRWRCTTEELKNAQQWNRLEKLTRESGRGNPVP